MKEPFQFHNKTGSQFLEKKSLLASGFHSNKLLQAARDGIRGVGANGHFSDFQNNQPSAGDRNIRRQLTTDQRELGITGGQSPVFQQR